MYARTCFASDLIGCGLSVPPPRPACALALAEMPGRSRCTERILGCLGPGRLGKLLWGSGSLEAAGEEAAWRGSTPSGGLRRPKSQGVEESCGGSGRALLISGAHWEQRSRRPRLQPVGWHSMSLCGPSRRSRLEANACRNCPFDCSFRPSPPNQSRLGMYSQRLSDEILCRNGYFWVSGDHWCWSFSRLLSSEKFLDLHSAKNRDKVGLTSDINVEFTESQDFYLRDQVDVDSHSYLVFLRFFFDVFHSPQLQFQTFGLYLSAPLGSGAETFIPIIFS